MASEGKIKMWVTLTSGWDGMPIAYHLQQEGFESMVGQVQDKKELKQDDKEEPEDKKERLSQYDGMVTKHPARKLVNALKKVKNKDDIFIFCDQNALWPYAEELLKAGFTKGIFPTKKDYDMEKEREEAMKFVEEHYPEIQIIPHEKVKTVEEAKKYVEAADAPLVIQSEGDFVATIVGPDDVEQSKATILAALEKHAAEYAKGEIILKHKLVKPVEITPQIVFWNGEPVFTDLDIETKNIGDGENNGNQVGCGTNLIVRTEMDDAINQIAFPPKVYEMAKEHKGIFVWDLSIYVTDDGLYFGEFCSNRFGYDALMTEMMMSGGAQKFFTSIMNGKNPLTEYQFGAALRVFNLNRSKDQEINVGSEDSTWLYEVKQEKDRLISVGDCWDLGVITGCGQTFEEVVDDLYENYSTLVFKEKYARTKDDFLADYPTSIAHRFKETNELYYSAPPIKDAKENYEAKVEKIKKDSETQISSFKKELKSILYGTKQGTI